MSLGWIIRHTVLICTFVAFKYSHAQILPENTLDRTTVCQGESLLASCPAGNIIAVHNVQYGTKLTLTCAVSDTTAGCCDYDAGDCLMDYSDTGQQAACSGRDLCNSVTAGQADTSSCGVTYPNLNHYLTMEYYCIDAARVSTICSAGTITATGSPLYLYNADYPSPIRSAETSCSCSIETSSCTSQIRLYLVHFQLDDGGNTCSDTQNLEVNDSGTTLTFTCSDNTDYSISVKATSTLNYLTVTFGNPSGTNAGRIWIGFEATDNAAPLKIDCPAAARSMCIDCPSLLNPNQGSVSLSAGQSYASVATYSCDSGFKVVGDATRECQANGTWEGVDPTCEPLALEDGCVVIGDCAGISNVDCRDEGSGLQCLCQSGYIGTAGTTTCNIIALEDTCAVVGDCAAISNVDCRDAGSGLQCLCQTGYVGTAGTTTCNIIVLEDECTGIGDCAAISNVDCRNDGSGLQCLCQTGYEGTAGTTTCSIVDCNTLAAPADGSVSFSGGTTYGETATFSCNAGYRLNGVTTRLCQADGTWNNLSPTCEVNSLEDACTNGGDCSEINNVECRNDGSGLQCLCESGYQGTAGTTVCTIVDCGPIPPLTDGSVSLSSGTAFGSEATFSCDTGYTLSGASARTCQADSFWDSAQPSCQINDCGALATLTDGSVSLSSGTTYGSVATFSCDTGYTLIGDTSRTCRANSMWDNAGPSCQINDCGPLATLTDGSVSLSSGTTFGSVATFSCDTGYTLNGDSTRTCLANSLWDKAQPTCQINDCGALATLTDGSVSLSSGTTYGSVATFSCDTGYTLIGDTSRTCLANSMWDNADPSCQINDCGALATLTDGSVSLSSGTTFGSVATFSCDTGYTLTGDTTRTCQANSMWDNAQPTCQINDCGPLATLTDGSVSLSSGTTFDSVATFNCDTGYTLSGAATRTCQANSVWDNAQPTCQINDCGALSNPNGATADTSAGTTYQSVATFTCNTGYVMNGVSTSTCQANGQWDNTDPVCTIQNCGVLPAPPNGAVSVPSGTTYGEIATYTCDTGYDLTGVASRTCQSDGTWGDSEPTCDIKDCNVIPAPADGDVTYSNGATTYNEVATFICDEGYNLNGDATRTCGADGNWGGTSPVCIIEDCGALAAPTDGAVDTSAGTTFGEVATYSCDTGYGLVGTAQRTCQADGSWDGNPPTCQIADCSILTSPDNGVVSVGATTFNAVATYSCDTGYNLVGVQSRVCQHDGDWSDSAPTCDLTDCGTPVHLTNGEFSTPTGTKYGASAIYSCTGPYGLVGSASVQCLDTGAWDTLPYCSPDCGTPPTVENGAFVPPSNTLMNATVTYTCNAGYEIVRDEAITCQADGVWTTAPGCSLVTREYSETCSITEQCNTLRSTCRSDGLGSTICQCAESGEIYSSSVDTCLADCGLLTDLTNGAVALPDVTSEGQTAVYSCDVGYALSDVTLKIRTCLATGEWSLSAPQCVGGCPDPEPPTNGYVNASRGRAEGDTITYKCDEGYRLVGEISRTCRGDTRTWSGNDPVCLIECQQLSAIEYGSVDLSSGYWEGTMATYVCSKDYALVGTSTRTCQSTGQWNGVAPTCIFAIFPDVLLVVGSLLILLVLIDIFVVVFVIYLRHKKKKKQKEAQQQQQQNQDFDDVSDAREDEEKYVMYEEKPLEKLENGIPPATIIPEGPTRSSVKKTRNSKVSPEDRKKKTPQIPRKPPVPKPDKSNLDIIPKPKPLPKGVYRNTKPFGPKLYGPEPIRFKNEAVPFVPLETSEPPPNTLQQQAVDELREEKVADVEKLLKDRGANSGSNDRGKSTVDEDQISIDHLTNPVFETDDKLVMMDYDAHEERKPITKLEDTQETLKGRINLPKVPEKTTVGIENEGEKILSEEARKHLKTTMSAYSPTLGNAQRKWNY